MARGGNNASSPSGSSSASTLYVRREAVYLGSDQVGILRVGQDDGPFSQFDNGVTTFQFGTGAWNGDAPDNFIGSGIVVFPFWSGIGAEYAVSKAAYFTPRWAGFDFAASFAPNNTSNNASALRRGRRRVRCGFDRDNLGVRRREPSDQLV